MATTKTRPRLNININWSIWRPALVCLLVLFVIFQLTFDVYAVVVKPGNDTTNLTQMIVSAVEAVNIPAPVEASTGVAYIPSSRLRFPAEDFATQIRYASYSDKSTQTDLQVTAKNLVSFAESRVWIANGQATSRVWPFHRHPSVQTVLDAVPALQACSRGYELTDKQHDVTDPALYFKKLSDGRILYFYDTVKGCGADTSVLLDYLKQVESY